jgi:Fe-S oxidoreductase/nitrate reductase gamma subunit
VEIVEVTRGVWWNVPTLFKIMVYLLAIVSAYLIYKGIKERYRLWKRGKVEERKPDIGTAIREVLTHSRILSEKKPGLMHALIFFGFFVLFIGTLIVAVDADTPLHIYHGKFYLIVSFLLEIAGLVLIVGLIIALRRRYVEKPERLKPETSDDYVVLWLLLSVAVTGFIVEGVRISAQGFPSFEKVSFVGYALGKIFNFLGLGGSKTHKFFWFIHAILSFGFISYIAYSRKLMHIIVTPWNIAYRDPRPYGVVDRIPDIEEQESFGLVRIEDLTWKQLMDLDACMGCGRCQDACPAYSTGKPLTPKGIIRKLRDHMEERFISGRSEEECGPYEHIEDEVIWSCTTCAACMEKCPARIEHIDKIVEMRRYLTLMEGRIPEEMALALRNMENNFNPWGVGFASRADWARDMGVSTMSEKGEAEYLLWVGCAGSFDDRYKKVIKCLVEILRASGVDFAILGVEEKCCGDSARRLGNEYLFEMFAMENVEVLKNYNVKKIITACPHGYHVLKNEYPQYGWSGEVYHHTEFILNLIKNGKIKLKKGIGYKTVYHDSCYLGRHNGIYNEPREILREIVPAAKYLELPRNRENGFCCGAGGGRMWLEERIGKRINIERSEEVASTGAELIVTACPFCLTMFEDGIKVIGKEEAILRKDIAEIVREAMEN